jgi:hypothetical protein
MILLQEKLIKGLHVGHGRVTVPFLLTLTLPWFSPITSLTILFTSSEIFISGSGKSTLECVECNDITSGETDKGPAPDQINPGEVDGTTHSSVLLPDPEINISEEVNKIVLIFLSGLK